MYENFVFSGMGFVTGQYQVTNADIDKAIDSGFLSGFDKERLAHSDKFLAAKEKDPLLTPFDFMAEHLMGFRNRYHVVPFPPREYNYQSAQSSLDLLVDAMDKAFTDSNVHPEDISAWMVGTATPHEMAPGIAETAKSYFTNIGNKSQTCTTTSACVGFNINIERALNFLKCHPEAMHVMVAHSEVMSRLLLNENDFVPFTTFGDAAAAVIISRVVSTKKEGILDVVNYEDMAMIDFLGADRNGDLIMDPRRVKSRAFPNITFTANELLKKSGWTLEQVDMFVPHQTGNAIVHEAGKNLNVPFSKIFQEVQYQYGNLSGASVPASLCILRETGRWKPGEHILTAVAGLGGEYGGFSYIVPEIKKRLVNFKDLEGKTALITGFTGGLGSTIAHQMAGKGCRLILQYNSNQQKAESLLATLPAGKHPHILIRSDFSRPDDVQRLINQVKDLNISLNFLVHTVAATGSVQKGSLVTDDEIRTIHQINHLSAVKLTEELEPIILETVLFTGSIGQEAQFSGSSSYVSSKRALYGFAASFARQVYPRLRCIFYIPGIIDAGMTSVLNNEQIQASMSEVGQKTLIPVADIANRMIRSLYIPKVANVRSIYEGVLLVRKDGYSKY